jgi:hypothetical protein
MELFQLRVMPGAGRAFTPTRGSMVVLTHVAMCTSSHDPSPDPDDRVTVYVRADNGSYISLGSLRAGAWEQFSIGGSGLCFSAENRVEVKHSGTTSCVALTGRIEAVGEISDKDNSDLENLESDHSDYSDEEGEDAEEEDKVLLSLAQKAQLAYKDVPDVMMN